MICDFLMPQHVPFEIWHEITARKIAISKPAIQMKSGTKRWHTIVEKDTAMNRLLRADITLAEYCEIVRRLHSIHQQLETQLSACPPMEKELPSTKRSALLLSDIMYFDLTPIQPEQFEDYPLMPPITSREAALGAMYVLDGSALGGMLIHKQLLNNLFRQGDIGGLAFFGADPTAGMSQWMKFQKPLERTLVFQDQVEEAVNAANRTFDYFYQCLRFSQNAKT